MEQVNDDSEVYRCDNCGNEVAFEDNLCPHCGADISGVAEDDEDSPEDPSLIRKLVRRYEDAYLVARAINGFGSLFKGIGIVIAILLLLIGLMFFSEGGGATFALGVVMAFGVFAGLLFYIWGVIVSALGQIIKGVMDSAVNSSPFLENKHKAKIMSLSEEEM